MLAFEPADSLTQDQHLSLLLTLVDAALDTGKLRAILQSEC